MAKIGLGLVTLADQVVAAAGTRQQLNGGTSLEVRHLILQWHPGNTGAVYVGDASVASGRGLLLNSANPVLNITVDDTEADANQVMIDLATVYIDAANTGDKLKVCYLGELSHSYNS